MWANIIYFCIGMFIFNFTVVIMKNKIVVFHDYYINISYFLYCLNIINNGKN